jgi:hypothetical protein
MDIKLEITAGQIEEVASLTGLKFPSAQKLAIELAMKGQLNVEGITAWQSDRLAKAEKTRLAKIESEAYAKRLIAGTGKTVITVGEKSFQFGKLAVNGKPNLKKFRQSYGLKNAEARKLFGEILKQLSDSGIAELTVGKIQKSHRFNGVTANASKKTVAVQFVSKSTKKGQVKA